MSFSDEPNVISEQNRSKKGYFIAGGVLLFLGLLASVVLYPRILDYQRRNTPVGPHDGNVYFLNLDGERFSMELARFEGFDFHLHVFLRPVRERAEWNPEEHQVRVAYNDEWETLSWDAKTESFGPTTWRFHPMGEFRFDIRVERGDHTLWSGRRWSFGADSHAGHGH